MLKGSFEPLIERLKRINMWNTLPCLLKNCNPEKEKIEKISSYIMINWLSGNPNTVIPANIINLNYNMPIYVQYRFLDDYFKLTGIKNKVKFIKYNKNDEKKNETIENIQRYYKVNKNTAKQYYNMMSKKERNDFRDLYKEGKV